MIQPGHQHRQHRLGHVLDQVSVRSLGTVELIRRARGGGLLGRGVVVRVRDPRREAEIGDDLGLEVRIDGNDAESDEKDAARSVSPDFEVVRTRFGSIGDAFKRRV